MGKKMIQDLRFSVRMLRTSKMLSVIAVLSLGLGIGVTSAIYAFVDQLLIHDVVANEPERLVSFNYGPWNSYLNYREIRDSGVFKQLASATGCYPRPRWRVGDRTYEIAARCVSGNYFEVVGLQAAHGRVFTEEEAAAEKDPRVVVISHGLWQQRLAGDPNVIGRILTLNHTDYTIISVLPADNRGSNEQVIVPLSTDLYPRLFERDSAMMALFGRLLPDRTPEQTQQALVSVLRDLERRFPAQVKLREEALPKLTPMLGLAKFGKDSWELKQNLCALAPLRETYIKLLGFSQRRKGAKSAKVHHSPNFIISLQSELTSVKGYRTGNGFGHMMPSLA
jgi:putative ABC transport system permease protein